MQMLYDHGGEEIEAELLSVCINLAANKRTAQLMCEGSFLFTPVDVLSVKTEKILSLLAPPELNWFCLFLCRKWTENAHEESSEDKRLPLDEDDQEHLAARRPNQTALHCKLWCTQ